MATLKTRLATENDLPALRAMYRGIVADLCRRGLCIWDDEYPEMMLAGDIANAQLFMLETRSEPCAAFALCAAHEGATAMRWPNANVRSLYLERLGVRADAQGRGIGAQALKSAQDCARQRGAQALRLFVARDNPAALSLYRGHGFVRAEGIFMQPVDDTLSLPEYGYEILL